MTDAHTKAAALAATVGDTLGLVQNITEQTSDSDGCTGRALFGASGAAKRPTVKVAPSHKAHGHGKSHKATARLADAASNTCMLEADVTVTYGMSAS
jgi:hypothetical protein